MLGRAGQYVGFDRPHLVRSERILERGHPHLLICASQHDRLESLVSRGAGVAQVRHTGARDDSNSVTVETLPAIEDFAFADHRGSGVHVDRGRRRPRVAKRRNFKSGMRIEGEGEDRGRSQV